MADEKFKLPRSSYEELTKIVKTYGHLSEPASLNQVSSVVGMNPTMISANNAFLTQIDVLESGQKKQASSKGRKLARALEHDMPDEIRRAWRDIVDGCEFLKKVVASIRIRNGMDDSTLQSHIAYSAGETKKPYVMTGARTVVDILRASDAIEEVNGKYSVKASSDTKQTPDAADEDVETPTTPPASRKAVPVVAVSSGSANVQISIDVRVDCKFSELDELGPKLFSLLESLKASANENSPSNE